MALPIQHFSDVLCIFALVAQVRVDELQREFGGQVGLDFHFCHVFGDTRVKIGAGWADRGGYQGYGKHVVTVAERFDLVVHPEAWTKNPPRSSLSAHLWLRAVGCLEACDELPSGSLSDAIRSMRHAFFTEARDIAAVNEQARLAEQLGFDQVAIQRVYSTGEAHAALAADVDLSRKHSIVVSPTLIFNEGRQRLEGNVGFRIIEANVRELLRKPETEASWC